MLDRVDGRTGELTQPLAKSHLVERVDAARLQAVAAEGPLEVGVSLEERDLDAAARQQQGERRTGRPRPDDDDPAGWHDAPYCRKSPSRYCGGSARATTVSPDGTTTY